MSLPSDCFSIGAGCEAEGLGALGRGRSPTLGGSFTQAILMNGKVAVKRRKEWSAFLMANAQSVLASHNSTVSRFRQSLSEETLRTRLLSLGEEWTERTVGTLFSDLPVYTLQLAE
eukprot:Gregarina_sp_Poly_1__10764@NODE_823_length_6130_cov_96_470229_g595_i0_p6_GENE_NODE_823_length_6130_cov_96_470229_g595_i0NODE_823_length_6130_cov_96_470229_g595_i0_p6_ORF_typecomplete_len116_score8_50_NODE_823_length_6130_cov_96_470229_g595_i022112558